MKISSLVLLFFINFLVFYGYSQDTKLSGVVQAFNKYPLNNVTVTAKKSKATTITNEEGKFIIQVTRNDVLLFEANGFESFRYDLKPSEDNIKINLTIRDSQKNRGLAIAGGYIKESDLMDGFANYSTENSPFSNFIDVYDAIKYAIPSVTIGIENGQKVVYNRGPKTLEGSNAALILVNKIPVDNASFINPSEIVSITMLSGPAAAIYGSRAGTGIISIITK